MRMHLLVSGVVLALGLSTPAFAQVTIGANAISVSNSSSSATNSNTNTSVSAPGLAASGGGQNCAGSSSFGIGIMGFGISGGSTHEMKGCEARSDALVMQQLGYTNAGLLRLCQNTQVAIALAYDGKPCPPEYYTTRQQRAIWGSPDAPAPTVSEVGTQTSTTPAPGQQFVVIRRMKISDMPSGSQYRTADGVIHTKP